MIGRTISHYRIVEKLGEGGMGVLYVAEDTHLGRRVAFKTLTSRGGENQHFRARFLREARAVSSLSHPNIAAVYDYGHTEEGDPYIVMELIKGETLSDLMHKEKLTISRSIEIIKQVAEALGEAHAQGIIHRDIKPSNVVINERGNAKVLDFGLAKQLDPGPINVSDPEQRTLLNTQTREGMIVGTPLYLSPEQAFGVDVDPRSDLFALGSLFYECITGKPAFDAPTATAICARIMRDDPPLPSEINPDVPVELDEIVHKALAKKIDARYQNADEMIGDLESARTSILGFDKAVTRIIPADQETYKTGTLAALSDIFRRPRLPIGYVAGAAALLVVIAFVGYRLTRARAHTPTAEAQRLYVTGTDAIRAGSFFQASKALELATKADDQFALAHARFADALMELDFFDRAKDEILRAAELTPDRSVLDRVDSLYLDALTATVRRNFPGALSAYSQIAQLQPDKAEVHVDLGRAYEKNNQADKAIESYLAATKRDPQNASAFLRLGVLYGRTRDMDASKRAFDKAEEIYQSLGSVEGRTEVALQRGVLLNDIVGKLDDARAQLEKAREMASVVNGPYQQIRILYQLSSVAVKQNQGAEAKQFATEALQLAQSNHMETLIARGFIEMGYLDFFVLGDNAGAERNFEQGLEFAQKAGARLNEARARLSLASLYEHRGEPDRALTYQEQALAFYKSGGYRTETTQAMNLRARLYRRKGDFKPALETIEEQLKLAEQTGDQQQIASAQTSLGALLYDEEKYAEALEHFQKSLEINRTLNNQLNLGYAFANCASAHWNLGHGDEFTGNLKQAGEIAKREDSGFKGLQASIALTEAEIALSDRQFSAAITKSQQALDLAGVQNKIVNVKGKYLKGLAQALSGHAAGQKLCEEALNAAGSLGDPLLLARAQLALAEASLVAGDAQQAVASARQAKVFFAASGLTEAEWRTWLIEGLASQKSDPEKARTCLKRAAELLASLEQKWGADVYGNYLARPYVQTYRRQLPLS
jgi:tetratricopeptide (TPR) repeat protein/predicted Ser/Thr protein kinase